MTLEEMAAMFESHDSEYGKFDLIDEKRSRRPDMHAFLLLDSLFDSESAQGDMVSAAEHDCFYLALNPTDVASAISEPQVIELIRCGVMLDEEIDFFRMFA